MTVDGELLRFRDVETGAIVPHRTEGVAQRRAAEAVAEQEAAQRRAAEGRIVELEAALRRLQARD